MNAPLPRVLVVEDDPSLRRLLTLQLESRGFAVQTADNGAAGFTALQGDLPHCVVLDLMMPVMDGFELLKRIRSMRRTTDIPVIILTASEEDKHRLRGQQYLADAYLNKPYDVLELVATIRRLSAAGAPTLP